ncbi:hypothetical protein FHR92_001278 [Fontibacillus solani]|uniref:Uncharacterized protein n=2 Tax=Fontibacillus TaxID=995014 RepID=A0A1G7H681_9BACL|nr:hypothetical protein [Fontibacillus solani]SDE95942.1 hypothetical protein SAMN04488542_10420 [Fontibacillus panacisegetis]
MKSTRKEALEAAEEFREKAPSPKFAWFASITKHAGTVTERDRTVTFDPVSGTFVLSYLQEEWCGYTVELKTAESFPRSFCHSRHSPRRKT